ncbi:hypothetical protein TWF225_008061 [Orbilia oligospora]|uniref:Uncharacterized protein n=1 Tax=Orbilia oligospora TaxID=2813651 RepID=A0A8H2DUB1_ORBOL|nr:hypothetical protein TWF225_008061 [Orbilia oligospora]KAF3239802.1 hypothetical protein TWF128_011686 [Orbilia oligospora]KAF3248000.1 hypothetical protein TWF217_009458 [Orbilia oligospora]TGJ67030.1 hypothetical protein EYR41_008615 [Orbilia oligospora]
MNNDNNHSLKYISRRARPRKFITITRVGLHETFPFCTGTLYKDPRRLILAFTRGKRGLVCMFLTAKTGKPALHNFRQHLSGGTEVILL